MHPSLVATLLVGVTAAQQCSPSLTASYAAPSLAAGYSARLVANGLKSPRSIKFDKSGHLLVVEKNSGVTALTLSDNGCATDRKTVIQDSNLNHAIELSEDGNLLYASSAENAWRWEYDPTRAANTSSPELLVENMAGTDHTTRTMLLPKNAPGMLVVCRGSVQNLDPLALDVKTGISQVKAFNLSSRPSDRAYSYVEDGVLMGWGLRNEVGVAEEPITGGIWGVENSVDQMTREGKDVHLDNPAEELNFLGYLNGTASPNQGRNFGYPECYTAWEAEDLPDFQGKTGNQFAIGMLNSTVNDTTCNAANRQEARLAFAAHMAPLDILFNPTGTAAWVTFHGSWNRDTPQGYKVSVVEFDGKGQPVEPSDSKTAARDIMSNPDNSACPSKCFRPVGLAWSNDGKRLFVSSDSTGEIYVIERTDGMGVDQAGSSMNGSVPAASNSSGNQNQPRGNAAVGARGHLSAGLGVVAFGLAMVVLL